MSKAKILILDDDPVARDIFSRVLQAEGYDVTSAGTAQQAIDLAESFQPQALVSDWMLKEELDGLDVARAIRDRQPELRVFFITGLPADHLRSQLNGLTVSRIYEKPAHFDPLLADLDAEFGKNGHTP